VVRTKSVSHGLRRQKDKKERKKVRTGTNTLFMTFKEKSYIFMLKLASNVGVYSVEAAMEVLRRTKKLRLVGVPAGFRNVHFRLESEILTSTDNICCDVT